MPAHHLPRPSTAASILVLALVAAQLLVPLDATAGAGDPGPGDLDATFGSNGQTTIELGGSDGASAVALQPDGKVVTAGWAGGPGGADVAVARHHPDGRPDRSFSRDGFVTTDLGAYERGSAGVLVQPDGRIVVGTDGFSVVRYRSDGRLDRGFGDAGVARGPGDTASGRALGIQSTGAILLAGWLDVEGDVATAVDFLVVRFRPDGRIDPTFGRRGRVRLDIRDRDHLNAMTVGPDDSIVLAGETGDAGAFNDRALVVRLHPDGAIDSSFGRAGVALAPPDHDLQWPQAVALQPDGAIVVGGFTYPGQDADLALARLGADGAWDRAFGADGVASADSGRDDKVTDLAIGMDGRIVAAGDASWWANLTFTDWAVAVFDPDGTLWRSFGDEGVAQFDLGHDDLPGGVALAPDGRIVMAGLLDRDGGVRVAGDTTVLRVLGAGPPPFLTVPDAGFLEGNDGFGTATFTVSLSEPAPGPVELMYRSVDETAMHGTDYRAASGTAVIPAGEDSTGIPIRIAGDRDSEGDESLFLDVLLVRGATVHDPRARVAILDDERAPAPGDLDEDFGFLGKVTSDFGSSEDAATALAVLPDGKLLVVKFGSGYEDFYLIRYSSDGSIDRSFGVDGVVTVMVPDRFAQINRILFAANGDIIAAGSWERSTKYSHHIGPFVARFRADGRLRRGFGDGGFVTAGREGFGYAAAMQEDGKILVAGGSGGQATVNRYLPDGTLDPGFDEDGDIGFNDLWYFYGVAVGPGGRILLAGSAGSDFVLLGLTEDGRIDREFGRRGRVVTEIPGARLSPTAGLVMGPDGGIHVGGTAYGNDRSDFALARYLPNGRPDRTLAGHGPLVVDLGAADVALAIVRQPDGRILLVGYSARDDVADFAVARVGADGLDASFGEGGFVLTDFDGRDDRATEGALDPEGKLVVAGKTATIQCCSSDLALARYLT